MSLEALSVLTLVGGLDLAIKYIGAARCKRNDRKFQAFFSGMMDGGVELETFIQEFATWDEERQGQWCDRFQEVIQSKSMKAIPAVGWLLSMEWKHPYYQDFYVYLKAAQGLLAVTDQEYDFLCSVKQSYDNNYQQLQIASNSESETNIAQAWAKIWRPCSPDSHEDNQLKIDALRAVGLIDKQQYRDSNNCHVGGRISSAGQKVFRAIDEVSEVEFRDLTSEKHS